MLQHPTLDKLRDMRLFGMLAAIEDQMASSEVLSLSFDERFALLVDREKIDRENRRLTSRLKKAKLRLSACVEDIDYKHRRGLDRSLVLSLTSCQWIHSHDNLIITGPTGTGKTYLACAFGQKACREGFRTLYLRMPRFFQDLSVAKGDGRYPKLLTSLAKTDLLILDDWGTDTLSHDQRHALFEIIEDRYDRRSTLVATQFPVDTWHDLIGDPTLADAILDRLVHNAHKITLKGGSMRRNRTPSIATDAST